MLLKDDVSGKEFNSFLVHPCPHPIAGLRTLVFPKKVVE